MRTKNPKTGFTIIEVTVASAILGLIGIAVGGFIYYGFRSYDFTIEQSQAIENARQGIETMTQEIREIAPADTGAFAIDTADKFNFTFYGDIDKDAATERVRYFLDGTEFKKGTTEASGQPLRYRSENEVITTLAACVQNNAIPIFTFYNGDYPADMINNPLEYPADVTDIKLVHVYLKINVRPERAPDDYDLETDINIRNLKENL